MNSEETRYKLGITEIIAFIVGIVIMMGAGYFGPAYFPSGTTLIVFVTILSFFSSMYGIVVGGLLGFLGVASVFSLNGLPIQFADAFAMTVLGILIGRSAPDFKIRLGGFKGREITLFLMIEGLSCIIALIFIKPLIEYIFYGTDLFKGLYSGISAAGICGVPINLSLAILFYVINAFYANAKS